MPTPAIQSLDQPSCEAFPGRRGLSFFPLAATAFALAVGGCATVVPIAEKQDYPALMAEARKQADAGETAAAIATFEQAGQASPGRFEPYREIAGQQAASGQHAQAVASAGHALELDPADQESRDVFVDSGLQVAIAVLEQLRAGGTEQVEGERPQAQALAELLVQVFGANVLPDEVRKRLARDAVEQWKRTQHKGVDTPKRPVSPLDALGGD